MEKCPCGCTFTDAQEVLESFEASFAEKRVIPHDLEIMWLKKAIARFSIEIDTLNLDERKERITPAIDQYIIDTLAAFMKQSYQEREVSKVNKRVSIVTKSYSVDGNGNTKTAAKNELDYDSMKSGYMANNLKPTAYV